jgi:hypothetical protein
MGKSEVLDGDPCQESQPCQKSVARERKEVLPTNQVHIRDKSCSQSICFDLCQ